MNAARPLAWLLHHPADQCTCWTRTFGWSGFLKFFFQTPFATHLVFKGGSSLSKAYQIIRRFSEDVDLTYDIRVLAPGLVGSDAEPSPLLGHPHPSSAAVACALSAASALSEG